MTKVRILKSFRGRPREKASKRTQPELTVHQVLSRDSLRRVWKAVKSSYREQLVRDPLDLLAFETNLDSNLKQLEFNIRADRYRPSPTLTIRAAKRDGMTRPLNFLEISDTLVLKAITDAMQDPLQSEFPSCVGFSRSQKKSFGATEADYETWIEAWVRHQDVVKNLLEGQGCQYIVQSDIANFFPSISHRLLRQLVTQRTKAEERLINLLFFLLESMTSRPGYSENRHVGLPQENYDSSRVLAHAFLHPFDQSFQPEIDEGRYARWVDDILVAVPDQEEGRQVLRRVEHGLEERGLFPSSAKCRIVSSTDFAAALYAEFNEFLDTVYASMGNTATSKVSLTEFEDRLLRFLEIPPGERLRTWDRVLRRFYTLSRHVGSSVLEGYSIDDIRQYPACVSKTTRCLLGRPFSPHVLNGIVSYLKSRDNIYQDVEILLYEFLLTWCIPADSSTPSFLADEVLYHFFARSEYPPPQTEYVRGLMALTLYKFGSADHLTHLAKCFFGDAVHDAAFAQYVLCVLVGTDAYRDKAFAAAEKIEDRTTRRIHSFLGAVRRQPQVYKKPLKRFVNAQKHKYPTYFSFPARMLPLVRLVRSKHEFRREWDAHLGFVLKKLRSSNEPLFDEMSIRFIEDELHRA